MGVRVALEAKLAGAMDDPRTHQALRLAGLLDAPDLSPRDAAGLSRELRVLLSELDDVAVADTGDLVDELAEARAARLSS